ncbi:MAG: hypothetical protein ACI4QN_03540 [Candidatus Coproplasma sp.]
MKTKALKIINLIVAVLVSVFALGYAFAWLAESRRASEQDFNGSSGQAYFAGGEGTEESPYQINDKYHLYNLAWLQNTGKLDGVKYYFELTDNVTIPSDFWLPPIGTDDYAFASDFNGNGYKITNLKVTTDSSKLAGVVSGTSVKFSNAVGMFGMTDAGSNIHNFILESPVVEVANANATYSASANRVAGIAVGHVAKDSKVSSIGVLADQTGTQLLINKSNYSTFNSIIGELADGVESSVTGGGHTSGGGSGANFGSSLDVDGMLTRIYKILENKKSSTPSSYLPDIDTQNDYPVTASLNNIPFVVTDESTYVGAEAKEVVANTNVGYFCGNQNKINKKTITFATDFTATYENPSDPNSKITYSWSGGVPKTFFTRTGDNATTTSENIKAMTDEEIAALPTALQAFLSEDNANKTHYAVRLQQRFEFTEGNDGTKYSKFPSISYYGNTYTDVYLPNNGIWVKPKEEGKMRFLVLTDSDAVRFTLYKITRDVSDITYDSETEFLQKYFRKSISGTTVSLRSKNLPADAIIYFEYDVSDIGNNVEFLLGNDDKDKGAYFLYLDIGSSGTDGDEDTGKVDYDKAVSAVDFIYDGVSIAQEDDTSGNSAFIMGDFIIQSSGKLYEATGTSIYFENLSTVLKIVYLRKAAGSATTMEVTVTGTTDNTKVSATKADKVDFTFNA